MGGRRRGRLSWRADRGPGRHRGAGGGRAGRRRGGWGHGARDAGGGAPVAALTIDAAPIDAAPIDAGAPAPPPGWVDIAALVPDAVLDLRYATADNIAGVALYPVARCWMRAAGAERLARAAATLRAQGFRLLLWDCYRPASVQQALWDRVHDPSFVARPVFDDQGRPVRGSAHSRGLAVDLGLADAQGAVVPLPTDHDDFTRAARGDRARGEAGDNFRALRAAMVAAGFTPLASEWWHYEARGAARRRCPTSRCGDAGGVTAWRGAIAAATRQVRRKRNWKSCVAARVSGWSRRPELPTLVRWP